LRIPFRSIVIFSVLSFVVGLSVGMFVMYPLHFQAYLRENYGTSSLSELNRILSPHLQMRENFSLNEIALFSSQTALVALLLSTRFWKNDKYRLSRKILLAVVFVGFLGGCFSGDRVSLVSAQTATYVVSPEGAFVKDVSFIIYYLNGKCYAVNGQYGTTQYKGTDNATVINDVLTSGLTAGRTWKEKIVVKGKIKLSRNITIPSYTIFDARQAIFEAPDSGWAFVVGGQATITDYVDVFGLRVIGNSFADGGLKLDHVRDSNFYDMYFIGFKKVGAAALLLDGATHGMVIINYFYNCKFLDSNIGAILFGKANFNNFYNCGFDNNDDRGLYLKPSESFKPNFNCFYTCDFEYNANYGIDDNSFRLTVRDAWFEGNGKDVRLGEEANSQGALIAGKVGLTSDLIEIGANGCNYGIVMDRLGKTFLDGRYKLLDAGVSNYTVNFPSGYVAGWGVGHYYYDVVVNVSWNTTVYIEKRNDGFIIHFGTPTPDAKQYVEWRVLMGYESGGL